MLNWSQQNFAQVTTVILSWHFICKILLGLVEYILNQGTSNIGIISNSINLSMASTGDVWIIPSFRIWGYVLHVEHISCVITNCGQLQWAIPSLFSIALEALLEKNITRKLLSLSVDLFFKILLFQVTFLISFSTAIFSPYFLQVGLLLQHVALFQSGN